MTPPRPPIADEIIDAAVEWMLRLETPQAGEAEWLAFDAWLGAHADHATAYDRALALASDLRAVAAPRAPTADVIPFPARAAPPPARPDRRALWAGLAAVVVAMVAVPVWRAAQPTVYETEPGERRTIALKDGSRVDLNGDTRLSVKYSHGQRLASLDGQAVFDVVKDADRPFLITAGDRRVRVVGTQFDVRRREGRMSVTVTRGVVEVAPTREAVGPTLRLTAGHRLDHIEGDGDGRVSAVVAEDALGWRNGRLIYREAPLADVVADLNAQYVRPIKLSDGAGGISFSGVLVLDDQVEMVRRLSLLAPVSSTIAENEIILRAEPMVR